MAVKFSIVILTKNSIGVVEQLVETLLDQDFNHEYEVLFMDNQSDDGTVEYLKQTQFPSKQIFNVPEGEFSHSGTRMRAAEACRGDWILFFTDDIQPIGRNFLADLTRPALKKEATAVYAVFQIDPERHDPIDAYLHNPWYNEYDELTGPISQYCWELFPAQLRRKLSNFDNCASCISREILMEFRCPDVPYGEDMLFARKLLLNGQQIALAKEAKFFHWHRVSFSYLMKRMCIDQYLSIEEFNIYYVRSKLGVIKAILSRIVHRTGMALFKIKMPLGRKIYWICYNIKTLSADFLGKYIAIIDDNSGTGLFGPLNRKLLKLKKKTIDEIYTRSILRY